MTGSQETLTHWLLSPPARALGLEAMLAELANEMHARSLPVWRINLSLLTLHPEVWVRTLFWKRGQGTSQLDRTHDFMDTPAFLNSPVAVVRRDGGRVRRRLSGPDALLDYPICVDLKEAGGTDYAVFALEFGGGRRTFVSFATDNSAGFSDGNLQELEDLLPALALRVELDSAYHATHHLLDVYLGHNAARRVLAGAFKRGTGETVDAVVWFCDLRGFTALSDSRAPADVVAVLDAYFDGVAGAVAAHGGEVLKFIGDAVLAIFAVDGRGAGPAALSAVAAARDALAAMDALNQAHASRGDAPLGIGVAVHLGQVMYGNIGAAGRLDFTVIGASVNEVCRLEALCKPLHVPLLLSEPLVRALGPGVATVPLGRHGMKGVSQPPEVFTLPQFAPASTQAR